MSYSQALECSLAAAAWELRETFLELSKQRGFALGLPLDSQAIWVGTVADPWSRYESRRITTGQLVAYFDRWIEHGVQDFIECGIPHGKAGTVAAAAVGIDHGYMRNLFSLTGRPAPDSLREHEPPAGRSAGAIRAFHDVLLEITSSCANRIPDDQFCRLAASLTAATRHKDLSRILRNLASQLARDDFPKPEALQRILRDYF